MPYIKQDKRICYDEHIYIIKQWLIKNGAEAGDMNYVISKLLWEIFDATGGKYDDANKILGMLNAVGREFYRRKVAPYEDAKIKENGDIQ